MLFDSLADQAPSRQLFDPLAAMSRSRSLPSENDRQVIARSNRQGAAGAPGSLVKISPQHAVARRGEAWRGIAAEIVQATCHEPVEYRFKAPVHLLIVYEQGVRHDGETFVDSLPRSTLHDVTRKLTFVPAGHEYRESQYPRVPARLLYFYVDPTALPFGNEPAWSDVPMAPRLFFEDASLWGTAIKLKRVLEEGDSPDRLYVEALGCVLAHELAQLGRGGTRKKTAVRGGLASWQQRVVTAHIEEHVTEPISLATLAGMVRLSPYYFCRAFKQSLGMPPHRYHMSRRIERAKMLLAERKYSITEVGLTLGFSDTSSFTAAFRRVTGLTPSGYSRNLI
jgi:AraC family transcriptional regulator